MASRPKPTVAIVDYGMGNLFSVRQACAYAGLDGRITSDAADLAAADAVLLPGVGAFSDAMAKLDRLELIDPIRRLADDGKPLIGVCLGMQLLMTESDEFGTTPGLGIIPGSVIYLSEQSGSGRRLKIPQVSWNRVFAPTDGDRLGGEHPRSWSGSPLEGLADGEFMYFVHSLRVVPDDSSVVLSVTPYGEIEFCSTLWRGNIFATQYHPERSGPAGLRMYENIHTMIASREGLGRYV
jgi:glutamine amidotransferase